MLLPALVRCAPLEPTKPASEESGLNLLHDAWPHSTQEVLQGLLRCLGGGITRGDAVGVLWRALAGWWWHHSRRRGWGYPGGLSRVGGGITRGDARGYPGGPWWVGGASLKEMWGLLSRFDCVYSDYITQGCPGGALAVAMSLRARCFFFPSHGSEARQNWKFGFRDSYCILQCLSQARSVDCIFGALFIST